MTNKNTFFVLWDQDGTLYEFKPDGNYYTHLYFYLLRCLKNTVMAASLINGMVFEGYEFVSCVYSNVLIDSPHDPEQEKNDALDRDTDIPRENRIFMPCGSSKWENAVKMGIADRCILIDDYGKNLEDWQGPKVKVSRDAEDRKKEMLKYKYCISPDQTADDIIKTILSAVKDYLSK